VRRGLTSQEDDALASVPPMTADTLALLSGLVSRIGLGDPGRRWALGNWFADPLDRTLAWSGADWLPWGYARAAASAE
jgi:hypothetical protein